VNIDNWQLLTFNSRNKGIIFTLYEQTDKFNVIKRNLNKINNLKKIVDSNTIEDPKNGEPIVYVNTKVYFDNGAIEFSIKKSLVILKINKLKLTFKTNDSISISSKDTLSLSMSNQDTYVNANSETKMEHIIIKGIKNNK
jgi:hypothetical protein